MDVWVTIDAPSLAAQQAKLAGTAGIEKAKQLSNSANKTSFAEPLAKYRNDLAAQQSKIAVSLASVGAEELARVHVAHNAIAVRVDASQLEQLALIPGVAKVRPVLNYEMSLSETVPYVGGTAVQQSGMDGTGVTVAVLDSGIDYTHRNLGGAGTLAAYAAAHGGPAAIRCRRLSMACSRRRKSSAASTSSAKHGRHGARTDDPDPIDFQGHGTHVADIIGGKSADGTHVGMAPGASLLAIQRLQRRRDFLQRRLRCCWRSTLRSIRTVTAISAMQPTSSTCRSARITARSRTI